MRLSYRLTFLPSFAALCVASCGGKTPATNAPAGAGDACRFLLAQRTTSPSRLPPIHAPPPRLSRIVVQAEVPFARIKNELEAKVAPRLADVHGSSLGIAGTLNYTADRGPFALSVENGSLIVRTDVRAHAEACARGSCYASCNPTAVVRAEVPLKLLPEYRFAPSRVTAQFTRGCKIRALGGFLTIDVTPTIQEEIAPMLRRVQQDIDHELPDVRPQAERLWAEVSKPRTLPLIGCTVMQPSGIVEGAPQATSNAMSLRFALVARPELRATCGTVPPTAALPPLVQDPNLPAEDEVLLGMVSPLDTIASALEATAPFDVGGAETHVEHANVVAAGSALDADLTLKGDACGDVALRATPSWSADRPALDLTAPTLTAEETERISGASLDPKKVAAAVTSGPNVPVLLDPDRIGPMLPALASSLSDDTVDASATVSSVRRAGAAAREGDIVAWVAIRGGLVLRQK